jgi:hypothetical protein
MVQPRTVGLNPPPFFHQLVGVIRGLESKVATVNPNMVLKQAIDPLHCWDCVASGTTRLLKKGVAPEFFDLNLDQHLGVLIHGIRSQTLAPQVLALLLCFLIHVLNATIGSTQGRNNNKPRSHAAQLVYSSLESCPCEHVISILAIECLNPKSKSGTNL